MATVSRPSVTQPDFEKLDLLYVENAKVIAIFWEWWHKVMTHFFTAVAGILILAGWFYERKELKYWLFLPLMLGAIYSVVVFLMDRINRRVLVASYDVGKSIEERLGSSNGPYTRIANRQLTNQFHYSTILSWVYITVAVLLLVGASLAMAFVH